MDIDETRYYRCPDGSLFRLEIVKDDDPLNPRTDCDNVSTMVCFHRRYKLGDVSTGEHGKTVTVPQTNVLYDNSSDGAEALGEWIRKRLETGDIVVASLELYDHSGITIRIANWGDEALRLGRTGWDSCTVGFVFITKERAISELAGRDGKDWAERARECILGDVETYDNYLTDEVYGYRLCRLSDYTVVENGREILRHPRDPVWNELDACAGYYGDDHAKSGLLDCLPEGAVRITKDELPDGIGE